MKFNKVIECAFFKIRMNGIVALIVFVMISGELTAQDQTKAAAIDKASISFRIGLGQSLPEKRFTELLDLFDKYKGVTDEITFFSSITHPPLPLEVHQQRMIILKQRMIEARKRGYRTG